MKNKVLLLTILFFLILPFLVKAFSVGEKEEFFVEPSYDYEGRRELDAEIINITGDLVFYVDQGWWEDLSANEKRDLEAATRLLGKEFEEKIFPQISSEFGNPPKHSITGRDVLFVLFHPMENDARGYFRTGDQYSRYHYRRSNERNILYLNANFMEDPNLPGYLAHEYMHLVTFNEKDKSYGETEEVWLDELRAEFIISFLNYNEEYRGSNLHSRARSFLRNPDFSLTEWTEEAADYGAVNLFGHYIADHYGEEILQDSLGSQMTGIPSIDYALDKHDYQKTFAEVFTDWTIAVYLNDCFYGDNYCYKHENLENLKVSPSTFSLSLEKEVFRFEHETKNWAGNWHRFQGEEEGTLYLTFDAEEEFTVPYILCREEKECTVKELEMDEHGRGEVIVENFGSQYASLTAIPSLQEKYEGFNGKEKNFSFSWEARMRKGITEEEIEEAKEKLTKMLERLERLYYLLGGERRKEFNNNLYYGMTDSEEVRRLQKFLKEQGDHIYPEGLVTGNFYELTHNAVIRFQEEHQKDILSPFNLKEGTGYVGEYTRRKLNEMITARK